MFDEVGRWSQEKLELLRQYLAAYTSILMKTQSRWCKKVHYVDAFSGGVWHITKENGEVIPGSPILALRNDPPFTTFTFIDINKERIDNLITPLKQSYPEKNIFVELGDCNDILIERVLPHLIRNRRAERGFIFLDPYGVNLWWDTVVAIADTKVFDVLINFPLMGIFRQLGAQPPEGKIRERINRVIGTEDWFNEIYKEPSQCSLFENLAPQKERIHDNIADKLAQIYQHRLTECFGHVSDFVVMRTVQNAPIYALMLASHVKTAKSKMHEIFKREERKGKKWRRQP